MIGAKEVKALRDKLGITQEELAVRADIPVSSIQNYEQARSRPTKHYRRHLLPLFKEAGMKV